MRMKTVSLVLLASACASAGSPRSEEDLVARARGIHQRVLTMDTHDDIPGNFGTPEYNACNELSRQVDLPKMRRGGLDVAFFAVYVGQGERTGREPQDLESRRIGGRHQRIGPGHGQEGGNRCRWVDH